MEKYDETKEMFVAEIKRFLDKTKKRFLFVTEHDRVEYSDIVNQAQKEFQEELFK